MTTKCMATTAPSTTSSSSTTHGKTTTKAVVPLKTMMPASTFGSSLENNNRNHQHEPCVKYDHNHHDSRYPLLPNVNATSSEVLYYNMNHDPDPSPRMVNSKFSEFVVESSIQGCCDDRKNGSNNNCNTNYTTAAHDRTTLEQQQSIIISNGRKCIDMMHPATTTSFSVKEEKLKVHASKSNNEHRCYPHLPPQIAQQDKHKKQQIQPHMQMQPIQTIQQQHLPSVAKTKKQSSVTSRAITTKNTKQKLQQRSGNSNNNMNQNPKNNNHNTWKSIATFSFFCLLLVAFIAFTIMTMYCFIRVIQIEEEQDFHDGKSLRNIRKQYQQQQRRMKNNITSNGSNSAKNNQSALIPMIENKLDSAASSSSNNASTGTIVVNVNETIAEYNVPSSQEQNVGQEKPILKSSSDNLTTSSTNGSMSAPSYHKTTTMYHNHHHHHQYPVHPTIIPNTIIFTHYVDLLNITLPYQDNPRESLNDEEKEMLALKHNVHSIIQLHAKSTTNIQFLTDSHCINLIRSVMKQLYNTSNTDTTADAAADELVNYFNNEAKGMYKADLCRGVALYETGGLYFDVDLGVRMNIYKVIQPTTEFVTVRVHRQSNYIGSFFQAFIGVIPRHPVIGRYVQLFYHYYQGIIQDKHTIDGGPLGVLLLKRAYDEIQSEQELLLNVSNSAMNSDRKLTTNSSPTTVTHLQQTTELWQEVLYVPQYHKSILKHVPYPTWGAKRACKFIVVAGNVTLSEPVRVPFYSRIAGSRMCASLEDMIMKERIRHSTNNDHHTTASHDHQHLDDNINDNDNNGNKDDTTRSDHGDGYYQDSTKLQHAHRTDDKMAATM